MTGFLHPEAKRSNGGSPDSDAVGRPESVRAPDVQDWASVTVSAPIESPASVVVILACPACGETASVVAKLFTRVTKDSDGTGAMALRTRAAKVAHVCGQMALDLPAAAEGSRVR